MMACRSPLFEVLPKFVSMRHDIYEQRVAGRPAPWVDEMDPVGAILSAFKFTNMFRCCDRTSQGFLRECAYAAGASSRPEDIMLRTLIFKIPNTLTAHNWLLKKIGHLPEAATFSPQQYIEAWDAAPKEPKLWSRAYTQPPIPSDPMPKHAGYFRLLGKIFQEGFAENLCAQTSYQAAFNSMRGVPIIGGEFLSMQYLTDFLYAGALPFEENDFQQPGPGTLRGIDKCFPGLNIPKPSYRLVLENMCVQQDEIFQQAGVEPVRLHGQRAPTLADWSNIFCETDKLARALMPELSAGKNAPTRIKATFEGGQPLPKPVYPPHWGIVN
jgi:hypothetical protein